MNCPSCGADLPDSAAFCMECGTNLSPGTSEAPADPLREALVKALGSQYEVMRLLGRGGMGAVYLARESALDRLVAVKVLPPEASDDHSRERFQREARTAAKLTHPNIVPLYSFGETDGMMYFVMGFVQGESLADRMARQGKMPEKESRRILAETADALLYAHTQGVVHRDIKPDNILLDDATGKPMLTDFGIAKAQIGGSTLTAIGSVVGTPHYMSPEQASGERDIDGRSDIYSLGVVAYAMLSGELPFDGNSLQDIIVQHVTKEAPQLTDVAADTTEHVSRAVGRCLAKDPQDRWRDAGEFRAAIREEGTTEANLPLALRLTEGMVAKTVLMFSIATLALPYLYLKDSPFQLMAVVVMVSSLFGGVLGWFKMLREGKARGYSVAEMKALALRPPRWWFFGWPERWRGPEDLTNRLIPEIKKLRRELGWAGKAGGTSFYLALLIASFDEPTALMEMFFAAALVLGGGGVLAVAARARALARKLGIDANEMSQAINTPTGRIDLWRSPELSKFLLDDPSQDQRSELGELQTVQDFVEAIRHAGNEVHGVNRAMAKEALTAARQLISSIEKTEREIERASRDVNEDEVSKLEARLEALAEAAETKDDYDAEMEKLLKNQLLLHRRIAERLTTARERHNRMNEMLKVLWLHVSDLHTSETQEKHDASEITGKIRAVCEDIEHHLAATEETSEVLTSSG